MKVKSRNNKIIIVSCMIIILSLTAMFFLLIYYQKDKTPKSEMIAESKVHSYLTSTNCKSLPQLEIIQPFKQPFEQFSIFEPLKQTENYSQKQETISAHNLKVHTISVSCIKAQWKSEKGRKYHIHAESSDSQSKINIIPKGNNTCYITGLREDSRCIIYVTPILKPYEKNVQVRTLSASTCTEKVKVIKTYKKEKGWTNCFAGERWTGLTAMPSSGAIKGSILDPVTNTGIMRNEYGDYCCAMGLWYGVVGERFLIELENGTQFTVKICDSKGLADDKKGKYHKFGSTGKCIVEFIYDEPNLPSCVAYSGTWGKYVWNGLDLTANIHSIKKIEYGKTIKY